jgi:asparagine synthase (glutamine-hydrolysing)
MCRLAGIIDFQSPPSLERISQMRDAMSHGGPDDSGLYLDQDFPLALGFRRLSFQDLSRLGHQPMADESGQIILVFNGEIYNFKSIRAELESKNYHFKSNSDTEVIIKSYLEWGNKCFEKFNGMFALVLLDKRSNKLLLARDHAGIKPLYYHHRQGKFVFASEIRAFKKLDSSWPENPDWKKYFLMFGHLPEPVTTLEGVVPLPKGTLMELDLRSFKIKTSKLFNTYYNYAISDRQEALRAVRETLTKSVERHLISDAPIGLFLSGGLDSSLLTIIAKKVIPENLQTLSIIFNDEKYSEKYYQDIIIEKTNARHRSYLVTQEQFEDCVPDILKAMDQPSNDGINSYFISKYAHEYGLKAALSGIGSDEMFGGYPSFNRASQFSKLKWLPNFMFQVAGIFPDDRIKKISYLGLKTGLGEYLFHRGFFSPSQVAQLLECSVEEVKICLRRVNASFPAFVEKLEAIERISYLEANWYMQNQLLKDTDYMSMWHSLEVRVPFLDKELMDLVYSIDPQIRYSPGRFKPLLVDAFKDDLPAEIYKRPKQGFSFPFGDWMKKVSVPNGHMAQLAKFQQDLAAGKIHWSRYWSYVLSQQPQ